MINALLRVPIIGTKILKRCILMLEGGYQESNTIRSFYSSKYNVDIGKYSYGSMFSPDFNVGGTNVKIGQYCSFGTDIHYYGANHPYHYGSTSPYFYNKSFGYNVKDVERHKLIIGNDVWIGYGVIITCGCHKIGNGAVIGAGSVVTKDVQPYSIVCGVPGKHLTYRFDDKTVEDLEKSKWWELSPKTLMKYYDYISEPLKWANMIIENEL